MRLPPVYALVCLLVLGSFAYAKHRGLGLFSATGMQASYDSRSSSSGGSGGYSSRSSGGFSGSHK